MTHGRGIMPDYLVIPSIEDTLSGRDMEMEKAIELITKN
jgi:hypothetical protein